MIRKSALGELEDFPGAPIKKELVDAPGVGIGKRQTSPAPAQETSAPQTQFSTAVKQMQYAVLSIYDLIKDSPVFSIQEDTGAHPLSTSVLRYVNKSPVLGKEEGQQKGSIFNIDKFVSSLSVFGKESKKPDGVWGTYTNNTLKNLYAIVQSMFYMMYKLNIKQDVYSMADLEELKKSIPTSPNDLPHKDETAQAITKNITKVKALIGAFHRGLVGEHSQFAEHVTDNKPFATTYSKKYQDVGEENLRVPVLGVKLPRDLADPEEEQIPLMMNQLANKQSFEKFVQDSGIMVNGQSPLQNPQLMDQLLSFIENKVKSASVRSQTQDPGY